LSKKLDDLAAEFIESLKPINQELPIDTALYYILHQLFQNFENSPAITEYLLSHNEVDITKIKNTKLVFHEIITRYIDKLGRIQNLEAVKKLDEIDALHALDNSAEILTKIALEQEKVLKLPTLEQIREQNEEESKS
jgi:hypothetical protein